MTSDWQQLVTGSDSDGEWGLLSGGNDSGGESTPGSDANQGWREVAGDGGWGDVAGHVRHDGEAAERSVPDAGSEQDASNAEDEPLRPEEVAMVAQRTSRSIIAQAYKRLLSECQAIRLCAPPADDDDEPSTEGGHPDAEQVSAAVADSQGAGGVVAGGSAADAPAEGADVGPPLARVLAEPPPARRELVRQACGFGVLDPVLEQGLHLCDLDGPELLKDTIATAILQDLLSLRAKTVASDSAQAQRLNVDRKKLRKTRERFACAAVLLERKMATDMINTIIAEVERKGGTNVMISEFPRYDETPMMSRVKGVDIVYDLVNGRRALTDGSLPYNSEYDAAPQKILSTEWKYVLLFEIDGQYTTIEIDLVVPVQTMARGTGETYDRALYLSGLDLRPFVDKFMVAQRVASTDGDKAVARYERYMLHQRPNFASLHLRCVVHRAAAMKERVLDVKAGLIQEITHVVLSLRANRGIIGFRRAVKSIVAKKLRIDRSSPPPPDHQARHQEILDVFLPSACPEVDLKRVTIASLANGDWSDTTCITHHCLGSPLSDGEIRIAFDSAFVSAMVGSGPTSFPSRNWVGAEHAPSWLGLLAACHGLLQEAYCSWASKLGSGARASDAAAETANAGAGAPDPAAVWGEAPQVGLGDGPRAAAPAEGDDGRASADVMRELHAKYRATALRWLSSSRPVMVEMLCIRVILEPHRRFMSRHLHMSGEEWEQERMAADAEDLRNQGGGGRLHTPRFRLVHAHNGDLESDALDDFHELMRSESVWRIIPGHARTLMVQNDLFIMLSRSSCRAHRLRRLHEGFPYRMFGLIGAAREEVLESIQAENKCLMDPWSRRIAELFNDNLGGPDVHAILSATAAVAHEETVQIEARHATLRRVLAARSIQSKRLDMNSLNADKAISRTSDSAMVAPQAFHNFVVIECFPLESDSRGEMQDPNYRPESNPRYAWGRPFGRGGNFGITRTLGHVYGGERRLMFGIARS